MTDNMNDTGLGGASNELGTTGGFGGQTVGTNTFGTAGAAGGIGGQALGTDSFGTAGASGGLSTPGGANVQGLKEQAREQVQGVRDEAMKLKDQALDQARTAAQDGKMKAAETIEGVAQAARDAAGQLGQNATIAPVARYGEQAADALERFATTLRNKEVDQLVSEVAGMVRRNPAIAVGVAVAAGFAVSRLLRGGTTTSNHGGYSADNDYIA